MAMQMMENNGDNVVGGGGDLSIDDDVQLRRSTSLPKVVYVNNIR